VVKASVAADARAAERVARGAGRMLRADLMAVIVAVLGRRFAEVRVISYAEFLEQVADDLDELRDDGFTLPRNAQEYVGDWIANGYLVRRGSTAAREETVELARDAAEALRFVAAIDQPTSAVTSSRLANVIGLLGDLARDSDPDASSRLEALRARRSEIDEEMARIESGDFEPLDRDLARERMREILHLAGEIPGDFAKVADDLEALNASLREQIINNDGSRGGVLDQVFAGVDLIEGSEAGRTFNAFHELLLDLVVADRFDRAVDELLGRDFTTEFSGTEIAFLRRFLSVLQRESSQVRRSFTDFSRSLRRFVQTQEYREHKRLADALARADGAALQALRRHPPATRLGRDLDLTSMRIASITAWRLHNPADQRSVEDVTTNAVVELDLEQLRALVRLTEIDFAELQHDVADTVAARGIATVAEVLDRHPATQGLASVVGLHILAAEYGTRAVGVEEWGWVSAGGQSRTVGAPRYIFDSVPEYWSQP